MPQTFFAYLRKEQARLRQALALARRHGALAEAASLRQQLRIVQDQLARWTREFAPDEAAA